MECRDVYDLGEKKNPIERQESILCKVYQTFSAYSYGPLKFWIEIAFVNFKLTMNR